MHRNHTIWAVFLGLTSMLAGQPAPAPAPPPPPQAPQTTPAPTPPLVPVGPLNLHNASLTEVIDVLAKQLKINYIIDPSVKGGVTLNTYGDPSKLDARSLLDQILRINGYGMTQVGDLYRIIPLKDLSRQPLPPQRVVNPQSIPEDDQPMLNLVFLKYMSVDELSNVLNQFIGENAVIYKYPPANLLFILDSRRDMRRIMELIAMFDSDQFAGQRVKLFEVKNARPSDIVKELDNILKAISLNPKTGTVTFLPVDRINQLIAVAPNPGVFDTIEEWIRKLDIPVKITAGAIDNYVYHVKYGRSDCLAIALGQLFGTSVGTGYGAGFGAPAQTGMGYGGAYGGGMGGGYGVGAYTGGGGYGAGPGIYGGGGGGTIGGNYGNPGGYGNANNFTSGFGGTGSCGMTTGMGSPNAGGYGYPAFNGYAAQIGAAGPVNAVGATGQPLSAASPMSAATPAGASAEQVRPPRIVPNPLTNALIIQADAQQYQDILKILKDLDIPPRQILLESKIYEVDLNDAWSSGIQYLLQPKAGDRTPQASLVGGTGTFGIGTLVDNARELLMTLTLNENITRSHVISEPSLIATDSIPATINVGTQIPVSTGSTAIPTSGGVATTSQISSQNTGVTFQVNARVNPSGVVTLIINQEISGVDATATAASNLGTPAFDQQVVQTQITMMDGDTIAIGGTIQDTVTDTMNGIPFLDRLPYVGALFGNKSKTHTRSELIIFMTPHVIQDESSLIEASDELKSRVRMLRKTIRNM